MITLVMLLVFTILGVSAMQTTTLQERMSGNMRDREVAFQAAEGALRHGEQWLSQQTFPPQSGAASYLYDEAALDDPPVWETVDWEADGATVEVSIDGAESPARYVIEEMEALQASSGVNVPGETQEVQHMYRVTARGTGVSPDAVVVLQSTYKFGEG